MVHKKKTPMCTSKCNTIIVGPRFPKKDKTAGGEGGSWTALSEACLFLLCARVAELHVAPVALLSLELPKLAEQELYLAQMHVAPKHARHIVVDLRNTHTGTSATLDKRENSRRVGGLCVGREWGGSDTLTLSATSLYPAVADESYLTLILPLILSTLTSRSVTISPRHMVRSVNESKKMLCREMSTIRETSFCIRQKQRQYSAQQCATLSVEERAPGSLPRTRLRTWGANC